MNSVESTRPDYDNFLPIWKKITDVIDGYDVDQYLRELEPALEASDPHKKQRTKEYQDGAVFYPLVQQPIHKICAAAFKRDPVASFPSEYLLDNCDGGGVGLFQQARRAYKEGLSKARGALYVAVPPDGGDARINLVLAEQVINWRTEYDGDRKKLTLVVIKTPTLVYVNDFESKKVDEYLVLRYSSDGVSGQRYTANSDGQLIEGEEMPITDSAGRKLEELPFFFFGELNNDEVIDPPTMYPLCNMNIGHYRNSADFEESAFYAGNPIIFYNEEGGLNDDNYAMLNSVGFSSSSRTLAPFKIGLLQAQESTMSRIGMLDKAEAIANMLGALIGIQSKTATQVETENDEKTNTLVMVAKNVSSAYVKAIEAVEMFNGNTGAVEFAINEEFIRPAADAQMLAAMVTGFLQGAVPLSALFRYQKMHGILPEGMQLDEFEQGIATVSMPELG